MKALDYDEPCMASIDMGNNNGLIQVPTWQYAFRWFREKYKLQHKPWSGIINNLFYGYDILNIETQDYVINNSELAGGDCDYDTYEEAELACLVKLIEIAESK